jgi:hypothetical protein
MARNGAASAALNLKPSRPTIIKSLLLLFFRKEDASLLKERSKELSHYSITGPAPAPVRTARIASPQARLAMTTQRLFPRDL